MGAAVRFAKGVIDEIVARAAGSRDEVCGLLLGDDDEVTGVVHCGNVAARPATTFEIDPGQLIAALRAARTGGPQVLGCYHSHPRGSPMPSARDARDAAPNGWLWLIAARGEAAVWRAVGRGDRHGRFVAVAFDIAGATD